MKEETPTGLQIALQPPPATISMELWSLDSTDLDETFARIEIVAHVGVEDVSKLVAVALGIRAQFEERDVDRRLGLGGDDESGGVGSGRRRVLLRTNLGFVDCLQSTSCRNASTVVTFALNGGWRDLLLVGTLVVGGSMWGKRRRGWGRLLVVWPRDGSDGSRRLIRALRGLILGLWCRVGRLGRRIGGLWWNRV